MKKIISLAFCCAAVFASANVSAVTVTVNATSTPLNPTNFSLTAGQSYQITASASDLWSIGPNLPSSLWSNAGGLIATTISDGTDESGKPAGAQLGTPYNGGNYTFNGLSAPYGALVGQIDSNTPFLIGLNYTLNAAPAGTLKLFMWDDYPDNNLGSINANISAVPVPAAIWMLGTAMLGLVGYSKRKKM